MRFPDKITSYNESVLRLFPIILNELSKCDITPTELYLSIKEKASISDYIDALDSLFAMGKVKLINSNEVLHYVA